jgi:hypothetical protein
MDGAQKSVGNPRDVVEGEGPRGQVEAGPQGAHRVIV